MAPAPAATSTDLETKYFQMSEDPILISLNEESGTQTKAHAQLEFTPTSCKSGIDRFNGTSNSWETYK